MLKNEYNMYKRIQGSPRVIKLHEISEWTKINASCLSEVEKTISSHVICLFQHGIDSWTDYFLLHTPKLSYYNKNSKIIHSGCFPNLVRSLSASHISFLINFTFSWTLQLPAVSFSFPNYLNSQIKIS